MGWRGREPEGGWSLGEGLIKKQSMYSCRGQRGRRRGEERGARSDSGGGTKEQRREEAVGVKGVGISVLGGHK